MKTIIANPPFSASWSVDSSYLNDNRFKECGKLAPKSKADYAFIQDMIYKLAENGIMAVVLPHGVLFRGSSEGAIRRFLIEEKNCLDAVIGLPANIFFGTSIPTCILIFKKNRTQDDNIMFINASEYFDKAKNKNIIQKSHIEKITKSYSERLCLEKYSRDVNLSEIKDNDYNLNITRYVSTFEEEPPINIHAVMTEIKELEAKRNDLDKEIEVYLKELGLC